MGGCVSSKTCLTPPIIILLPTVLRRYFYVASYCYLFCCLSVLLFTCCVRDVHERAAELTMGLLSGEEVFFFCLQYEAVSSYFLL